MRKLKLIMGGMWGLFAIAAGLSLTMSFTWVGFITMVCSGVFSAVCLVEYKLTDENNWM